MEINNNKKNVPELSACQVRQALRKIAKIYQKNIEKRLTDPFILLWVGLYFVVVQKTITLDIFTRVFSCFHVVRWVI